MNKTNYAAKIPLTVQLLKGKKNVTQLIAIPLPLNSSISSKYVFIAVSDFGAKEEKSFETLHFRFDFLHPAKTRVKFPTPWHRK